MRDEHFRSLGREQGTGIEKGAAALREQIRQGEIPLENVELACMLGEEVAVEALGDDLSTLSVQDKIEKIDQMRAEVKIRFVLALHHVFYDRWDFKYDSTISLERMVREFIVNPSEDVGRVLEFSLDTFDENDPVDFWRERQMMDRLLVNECLKTDPRTRKHYLIPQTEFKKMTIDLIEIIEAFDVDETNIVFPRIKQELIPWLIGGKDPIKDSLEE